MSESSSSSSSSSSGGGCLGVILFWLLVWAIAFGVTIHGKHYGITCSCEKGVEVSP